jgi:hypothetical protein
MFLEGAPAGVSNHDARCFNGLAAGPYGFGLRRCETVADQVDQQLQREALCPHEGLGAPMRCGGQQFKGAALFAVEPGFFHIHVRSPRPRAPRRQLCVFPRWAVKPNPNAFRGIQAGDLTTGVEFRCEVQHLSALNQRRS